MPRILSAAYFLLAALPHVPHFRSERQAFIQSTCVCVCQQCMCVAIAVAIANAAAAAASRLTEANFSFHTHITHTLAIRAHVSELRKSMPLGSAQIFGLFCSTASSQVDFTSCLRQHANVTRIALSHLLSPSLSH